MSEHTHTYTHDHEHGDEHHEHEHHHEHSHSHETPKNREQAIALLDYNYKHNTSHADELTKLAEMLEGIGSADAAQKVTAAWDFFSKGNDALKEALDLLKKG